MDACNEAIKICRDMNWEMKSSVTLQRWHVLVRSNCGLFEHLRASRHEKTRLYPFLELNSSAKEALKNLCRSKIDNLSVEVLHDHIITSILPVLEKGPKITVLSFLS